MNEISNISSEKKKLSVTVKNIIRTLTFLLRNNYFFVRCLWFPVQIQTGV